MNVNYGVALLAGTLSFFSPCILPIIPSYLIFISGITLNNCGEAELRTYRKIVIAHALAFILGFSFVFVFMGLGSTLIGKIFFNYQTYIMRIGGLLLIVMGFHLLGILKIPFLNQEKVVHLKEKPLGFFGSFIVGATFSIGWTPCVGPVLSSILMIASTSETVSEGAYLLGFYSLGLAIPFFLSAIFFHKVFSLLGRFHFISRFCGKIMGAILILIGLLLLTNYFGVVTNFFNDLFY